MDFSCLASTLNNIGVAKHRKNDFQGAAQSYDDAIDTLIAGIRSERNVIRGGDQESASHNQRLFDLMDEEVNLSYQMDGKRRCDLFICDGKVDHHLRSEPLLAPHERQPNTIKSNHESSSQIDPSPVILHNKGLIYREQGDLDSAITLFHMSRQLLFTQTRHAREFIEVSTSVLLNIGQIYFENGLEEEAMHWFGLAIEEATQASSSNTNGTYKDDAPSLQDSTIHKSLTMAISHLGRIHLSLGEYDKAMNDCIASLRLQCKAKYTQGALPEASSMLNIGMILHMQGETEKAVEYIQYFLNKADNYVEDKIEWVRDVLFQMQKECETCGDRKITALAA